ncbi:MAG TPA: hypothetical protein DCQ64_28475 [Candidatus Rokubacteria bacterium]|nr:hypothetical protein [Candidatus Rokubacteria bacterium]
MAAASPYGTRERQRMREAHIWHMCQLRARPRLPRAYYWCDDCGYTILPDELYWRYYGKMGEAQHPFALRNCQTCHQRIWGIPDA